MIQTFSSNVVMSLKKCVFPSQAAPSCCPEKSAGVDHSPHHYGGTRHPNAPQKRPHPKNTSDVLLHTERPTVAGANRAPLVGARVAEQPRRDRRKRRGRKSCWSWFLTTGTEGEEGADGHGAEDGVMEDGQQQWVGYFSMEGSRRR